ncbi:MAG: hypothetical protein K2G38_00240, partial [Clostridia bacterium]|nr:hypothetical protein [Clostridia bacterium]
THVCTPTDHETENPTDDDKDKDEDKDNDKDDNHSGNNGDEIKNDDGNSGDDNPKEGDGNTPIIKNKNKFSFGRWSLKNLKNLFKKEFWEDLFTGKVGFDWKGFLLSVLKVVVPIAAIIVIIKLIKHRKKGGNNK